MKNTTEKTKKWAIVAGGLVLCAVLVALIGAQFKTPALPTAPPSSSEAPKPESEDEMVFVPNPVESAPATKPGENTGGNGDSSGTEQTIQPDVSKPEPPAEKPKVENEDARKDPSSTPEYKPEETEKKPTPKPDAPQNGDTKDGKIYIEGFGWIEDNGGGGQGETIDGDGDINKQVGEM